MLLRLKRVCIFVLYVNDYEQLKMFTTTVIDIDLFVLCISVSPLRSSNNEPKSAPPVGSSSKLSPFQQNFHTDHSHAIIYRPDSPVIKVSYHLCCSDHQL